MVSGSGDTTASDAGAKVPVSKIDLRPHYDHAPYTVHELLPLYRVSRLFMSMGLRHLLVVELAQCRPVGIVTRHDLCERCTAD